VCEQYVLRADTALAAHKEEVRTGGCAEHNRFAPAGLELFYQCWLDRSLGGVGDMRNPPCFVAGEQLRRCASARLVLAIDVGERLPVGVADAARTSGTPMLMAVEEM
jgi:hypothetical protein